MFIMSMISVI